MTTAAIHDLEDRNHRSSNHDSENPVRESGAG
jgi:hypothetical protein